jgi:hypothetical protein
MNQRTSAIEHRPNAFALARAQAEIDTRILRTRAARTVVGQAIDDDDRTRLLDMLGLEDTPQPPPTQPEIINMPGLERVLASYVHDVAIQVGVPAEATGFEISDTVTAYLGLRERRADCPNRDLMLVWNERDGWLVAAETDPTESGRVLGYLGGHDIVPHPRAVAQFVVTLLSGHHLSRPHPVYPSHSHRDLASLLGRHRTPHTDLTITNPKLTSHRISPLT